MHCKLSRFAFRGAMPQPHPVVAGPRWPETVMLCVAGQSTGSVMPTITYRPALACPRRIALALCLASSLAGGSCPAKRVTEDQLASGALTPSRRMGDGKQWMTVNLRVSADQSYCYDDTEANCRRYGRLYTWESAQRACRSLDAGW